MSGAAYPTFPTFVASRLLDTDGECRPLVRQWFESAGGALGEPWTDMMAGNARAMTGNADPKKAIGPPGAWYASIETVGGSGGSGRKVRKASSGPLELSIERLCAGELVEVCLYLGRLDPTGAGGNLGAAMIVAQRNSWEGLVWVELILRIWRSSHRGIRGDIPEELGEGWLVAGGRSLCSRQVVDFAFFTNTGDRSNMEADSIARPQRVVPQARIVPRGYHWGMLLSGSVVGSLGGVEEVRASRVFDVVEEAAGDTVWCQATRKQDSFTEPHLRRVFELLRPVLPARQQFRPPFDDNPWVIYDQTGLAPDPERRDGGPGSVSV
jgi:hypothetical protein